MAAVLAIFLFLLIISCASGYGLLRLFGKGLSPDCRAAVLPILGAAVLAIVLQFVHLFHALTPRALWVAAAPAAIGALLFVRNKPRMEPRAVAFAAVAIVCVLIPFWRLGRPTAFGIINNDAFYYSSVDYLVQHTRYADKDSPSPIVKAASLIRRFGLNYLSTLTQTITKSRSWETVHLTAAFGLLLAVCAGYLLARGLGGSPPAAAIAGLLAGMNHWVFRLYVDAVLAFMFGFAFVLAALWTCTLAELPSRTRAGLAGVILCGLTVFYFDLLPIFAVLAASVFVAGLIFHRWLAFPPLAAAAVLVLPAAVLREVVSHFLLVSSASGPGKHINWQDTPRTVMHLTGMMDVYDYVYWPAAITPLHVAGAAAVCVALLYAVWNARRCRVAAAFLLGGAGPLLALSALLFSQGRDYHAHRALTLAAGCAIPPLVVLAARAPQAVRIALAATVLLGAGQAVWRIMARFEQNHIVVTDAEKQVGEWTRTLADDAVVLIDLPPNATPFQSHYLYLETVHGLGGDESRVMMTPVAGSYLVLPPPDRGRATHILRLRDGRPPYELVAVR